MSVFSRPASAAARLLDRLAASDLLAAAGFALGVLVLSAQAGLAHDFKAGSLTIDHPWARATPGGATVGAGYMVVKNAGAADRLVSATSDISARTEIHEMAVTNGVMTMRPVAGGLAIPAQGLAELKPGSYHIMFIDLKQPLKEGERFKGTLTFEKAGTVAVEYKVEGIAGPKGEHDHPQMQMGK